MRIKEFDEDIAIRCKDTTERDVLLQVLENRGYVWYASKKRPTAYIPENCGNVICIYNSSIGANYKHITFTSKKEGEVAFSDVVIPSMSSEDIIEWLGKYSTDKKVILEVFGELSSIREYIAKFGSEEVVRKIEDWNAEHNNQEEVECFWTVKCIENPEHYTDEYYTKEDAVLSAINLAKKNFGYSYYPILCYRAKESNK